MAIRKKLIEELIATSGQSLIGRDGRVKNAQAQRLRTPQTPQGQRGWAGQLPRAALCCS